ncbi:MAG: DEAD/DEAH box helicase family protein [Candidatus Cohnella colombiensis]|uniref:DEAD/DEAH box helicase family protein n=1 Tax=Candidatus Cohnella colombiensis TaxID=3121368 RepID=A0AA95EU08_9BACL|nr:MAG: DEAD/DEAH box helicase family protein [Cohnella sp.]
MTELTLPALERVLFKENGKKNIIKQILVPAKKTQLNVSSSDINMVILEDSEQKYCVTIKSSSIPMTYDYVILSKQIPTETNVLDGSLKLERWLRHPRILETYEANEVIESWNDQFDYKVEDVNRNVVGLRRPQLGALHMIMGHFQLPLDIATVVMPTGTGKTETMLSALIANKCKKLLITVPSDALREQISEKFLTLGLLKRFGIVSESALFPIVGVVKEHFKTVEDLRNFFEKCNVVVSTMPLLSDSSKEQLEEMSELISHVFIDEAHHVKAQSWERFRLGFTKEKIVFFTATPFRNDGKRLDGKIIFNFPLLKAQEDGYFKEIEFISVRDYDSSRADLTIAQAAVQRLEEDHKKGLPHILMARCATKERASSIFNIYKEFTMHNPVLIHSTIRNKNEIYQSIINKQHRIIVCVDMLGEGFDLPELKIAAFHDIRKSLPITLQFTGRFTRTKYDEKLGKASFIANIADLNVTEELEELYAKDADWNKILSDISHLKIDSEIKYRELMDGFTKLNNSKIPFQNIRPKLSTVVYKSHGKTWNPYNFYKGIQAYNQIEYKFFDVNRNENIAIFVSAKSLYPEWINHKDIYNLNWDIIVMYWDEKNNLLFINSSDNGSLYKDLAKAVVGKEAQLINHMNVFRALHGINRIRLQNVGLKLFLGRDIRFRMSVGSDVGEALTLAEKQNGQKAFVVGAGYEGGNKVNIGCSYKGRIWTKKEGDLLEFKEWCFNVGEKLVNDELDPNTILRETLIPEKVIIRPPLFPIWIELDSEILQYNEIKYAFIINGTEYNLSTCEISLFEPTLDGDLFFSLNTEDGNVIFELHLFEDILNNTDIKFPNYKTLQVSDEKVEVVYGSQRRSAVDFFDEYLPTIWFADGSSLTGNDYIKLKKRIGLYPTEKIIDFDWSMTDLSKESQGVTPKIADSIQYQMINYLKNEDYEIIYDDDYSGEIADVITMRVQDDVIYVELYHLKFAKGGLVSSRIDNFYEVCGQAQKSGVWKNKDSKEFLTHLLRREPKKKNGVQSSRLEKGTIDDLERILRFAKKKMPMQFKMFIVQPSLSKANPSEDILQLLGVTENFLKETSGIELGVISSK